MITAKQIRQSLAGQSQDNVLVSDNGCQLVHKIDYRGWFDEAFHVQNFWIVIDGKMVSAHDTLQDALNSWDKAVYQPCVPLGYASFNPETGETVIRTR